MRKKKTYIVHNLSQGTAKVAYGVKEAQCYLRSKGCAFNNNTFNVSVSDMRDDWTGQTFRGSSGDEYEIDIIDLGN